MREHPKFVKENLSIFGNYFYILHGRFNAIALSDRSPRTSSHNGKDQLNHNNGYNAITLISIEIYPWVGLDFRNGEHRCEVSDRN